MDAIRFGLSVRALRRRRGWSQQRPGDGASLSRSTISRIERGLAATYSVRALTRVTDVLGARLAIRILWQGEELDRLLDGDHARLVEWMIGRLNSDGWVAAPEVTFRSGSERGSIDIFASHPDGIHLLVVEVKSVMPDVQSMLSGIDRKARLAPELARARGWRAGPVSRVLVMPDDRTARRRLLAYASTFARALPARTVEVRRWLAAPNKPIAGVLFVSDVHHVGARHRVPSRRARGPHEPPAEADI